MSFGGFNPNDCGNATPNMRLVYHLSQKEAQRDAVNAPQQQTDAPSTPAREHIEETTVQNFQTFRADELLSAAHRVSSHPDNSLLPSANIIAPNVSPARDWFFNQPPLRLSARPFPSRSFPSQSFPSQSFPSQSFPSQSFPSQSFSSQPIAYPYFPPTHFYRSQNISHPIYLAHPMLPAHVSRYSRPPFSGNYHPQSVMSVVPRSDMRPVQATVEDFEGPWDWSVLRGMEKEFRIAEAFRLFRDNEQRISTDNPGNFTGRGQREAKTSSDVEQEVDLGSLHIGEEAKSNTAGMEASGFGSTPKDNNSKYVDLLKRNQVQLNEEEGAEVNRDVQRGMEEVRNSNPSSQILSDDIPGFDEQHDENFTLDFLRKFSGLLSNLEDMNKYNFKEVNAMLELDDPFQEGLRRLEVGDIPSAVLCFEAAAQLQSENSLAWQYLGTTQAANEQDVNAIAALKECLKLEPDNLTALMALAISYTNEGFGNLAVIMLWKWLFYNPKYSDLVLGTPPQGFNNLSSFLNPDTHKAVQDMFIRAANRNPAKDMDPDVQCALGVLFNLIGDCSKASDCFKAALSVNPTDARMWNRLGATLANGQRSEEAVEAYYRSLSLNPGYVRARYNLAVSCINLGAQKEAIMHLLKALNLQANSNTSRGGVGIMSDSIWTTVRIVLSHLGRHDMLPAARNGDLDSLNKAFDYEQEAEGI